MKDKPMTLQELQLDVAKGWEAQIEMNEQALGLIFAIAIRLGISHKELLSEGEQIIEQIKKGQNPWG
jgi:hypothetical protein